MYLSDHFIYSLCVIQEDAPPFRLHCTICFHNCGNIGSDFHNRGNRSPIHQNHVRIWYNYLRSDSNKSVMFTSNAIAIISNWNNVGDTLPFSMLLIVDFPIPDFFDNSINVKPLEVRTSHTRIFTSLTSLLKEVYKVYFLHIEPYKCTILISIHFYIMEVSRCQDALDAVVTDFFFLLTVIQSFVLSVSKRWARYHAKHPPPLL